MSEMCQDVPGFQATALKRSSSSTVSYLVSMLIVLWPVIAIITLSCLPAFLVETVYDHVFLPVGPGEITARDLRRGGQKVDLVLK